MISHHLSNAAVVCKLRTEATWPQSACGNGEITRVSSPPELYRMADGRRWSAGASFRLPGPPSVSERAAAAGPAIPVRVAAPAVRGATTWRREHRCSLPTTVFTRSLSLSVGIGLAMRTTIPITTSRRDLWGTDVFGGESIVRQHRPGGTCYASALRLGRLKTTDPAAPGNHAAHHNSFFSTATEVYVIKPGDWVADVAAACGVDVEDIRKLNPTVDLDSVDAGQEIIIPKNRTGPGITWNRKESKKSEEGLDGGAGKGLSGSAAAAGFRTMAVAAEENSKSGGSGNKELWAAVRRSDESREKAAQATAVGAVAGGGERMEKEKKATRGGFGIGQWPFWTQKKKSTGEEVGTDGPGQPKSKEEEVVETVASGSRAEETDVYVMRRGDWVSSVAVDLGVSMDDLRRLNPGVDLDNVRPKQKLIVPKISRSADLASSTSISASSSFSPSSLSGATSAVAAGTCPSTSSSSSSSSSSASSASPSVCPPPARGGDAVKRAPATGGGGVQGSAAGGVCPPGAGRRTAAKSASGGAEVCPPSRPRPPVGSGGGAGSGAAATPAGGGAEICAPPSSGTRAAAGAERAAATAVPEKMCAPPPVCSPPAPQLKEPGSCPSAPRCAPPRAAQPLREPRDGRSAIARGLFSLLGDRGRQPNLQQRQRQPGVAPPAGVRGGGGAPRLSGDTELYKVRREDAVGSIAAARGIDVQTLLSLNPGVNLELLRVGQQIVVPIKRSATAATGGASAINGAGSGGGYVVYARHMVEPGDFLSEIADRYGVTIADVMKVNKMTLDDPIKVGQILLIPFRKEVTSREDATWQATGASTSGAGRGGGEGGGRGDGRSVTSVGGAATEPAIAFWSRVMEAASPLQGLVLAGTILGVGAVAAAGYLAGASASSYRSGGVMGRRVRLGREGDIPSSSLGRGVVVGGGGGGGGLGVRSRQHREDTRGVAMAAATNLSPDLRFYVEEEVEEEGDAVRGRVQGALRIGDGYSAGESLKEAVSKAVESGRRALGLAVATVAVVAVSGSRQVQTRVEEKEEGEAEEEEGKKEAAHNSRKRGGFYMTSFWNRNDDMIAHLCAVLPKPCALHGIAVTGLLANGRPAGDSTLSAGGGGGGEGGETGENEWAAVLLLSAPDGLVSATAMLGPGGAVPAVQMAVSQMTSQAAGLKSLKAVVVNASPGMGHDILDMVVGLLPGVPAYAVMAGKGSPGAKGWLVPSKTGFGAAGEGISLIGVTSEAEFGGAFLATVIGQWLYGPQCIVVARPPLIQSSISRVY